jgi:tetratricopeptide (TPR) repeat protein
MAEGLLGGVLGDEGDKPEVEAPDALACAEAFASAVAAKLAGNDPEVARETSAFLKMQTQLLEIQAEQLKGEHALRLAHLHHQLGEENIRRFSLRLRVGFQLFVALVATVISVVVAVIIRDVITSHRVVMEPFHAPPTLAARGLDGTVVAGGVLDELSRLQDATRSTAVRRDLSNAWARDIKLEVPDTGLSIAEISRTLRARFGHDIHIDGDLIETDAGALALTVRGNGVLPKTFSGQAAELRKLTLAAAEYVYAKSQPQRWASYLNETGRNQEAIEFCRSTVASTDSEDRAGLLTTWGIALASTGGSSREALALFRAAVKLKPDAWNAHADIQNVLMELGDEEGAWQAGVDMLKAAGGRPGRARELYFQNEDYLTWNLTAWLNEIVADADANAGVGSSANSAGPTIADIQIRLHDPATADLAIKTTQDDPNNPTILAMTHFVRGRMAAEAGNTGQAITEMEAFGAAYANPAVSSNYPGYSCWIAPAEEAAGHPDKADAALATCGHYVDGLRFRADILSGRGDWVAARKAYADAVALAPDLPASYYSWGVALAHHGDLADAEIKLKDAILRGPHWADPLKAWGDVLVKQGKSKEAHAKYEEALKYAPNWKELKAAREAAAKPL